VDVFGRGAGNARIKVCEFSQGQCIGELEFVNNHPNVADVVAATDVRTARLDRAHFELCMGPFQGTAFVVMGYFII
jgi:CRP-like cAMP-binding protein